MSIPSKKDKIDFLKNLSLEVKNRLVETKKEKPTIFKLLSELGNLNTWLKVHSKKLYDK